MKKPIIVLVFILSFALAACSKEKIPPDTGLSASFPNQALASAHKGAETEAEESDTKLPAANTEAGEGLHTENVPQAVPKEDYPDYLYGPDGDHISAEDITRVESYDYEEEKWANAVCSGFAYLAEPTGIGFNSLENTELFDNVNSIFESAPKASSAKYRRYGVGDSICGLTLKEAEVRFVNNNRNRDRHPESCFQGGSAIFEGELELTGYLVMIDQDECGVGFKGDMFFIPDNESQKLPIMNYTKFSEEKGVYSDITEQCQVMGGVFYQSEYPAIYCTMEDVAYIDHTFEAYTPIRVKIIADNISVSATVGWFADIGIGIKKLELL